MKEKLDNPLFFILTITLCVWGVTAVARWAFTSWGWTGAQSLVTGGVV